MSTAPASIKHISLTVCTPLASAQPHSAQTQRRLSVTLVLTESVGAPPLPEGART